jgi:hypothetical protein
LSQEQTWEYPSALICLFWRNMWQHKETSRWYPWQGTFMWEEVYELTLTRLHNENLIYSITIM